MKEGRVSTSTSSTLADLPPVVQKLIHNLREEARDYRRMRGDAVREMKKLRAEAAHHRAARNEARAELAALRDELEARRDV